MRSLQWLLLVGLVVGCERPHRADSLSNDDVTRILQENPGTKWERDVAKCLPPGMLMDMRINDSFTVRERLGAIGAKALDDRTLVDRDGNVIYRRPEPSDELRHDEWVKFIKALGVDTSAPPEFRTRDRTGNEAGIKVGASDHP